MATVATSPSSSTSRSRAPTRQWSPRELLSVDPASAGFTCIGWAPSKGRRCHNPVNAGNRGKASAILDELAELDPQSDEVDDLLLELASRVLCIRNHQSQADRTAVVWATRVKGLKTSRRRNMPAEMDRTRPGTVQEEPKGRRSVHRVSEVVRSSSSERLASVEGRASSRTARTGAKRDSEPRSSQTGANRNNSVQLSVATAEAPNTESPPRTTASLQEPRTERPEQTSENVPSPLVEHMRQIAMATSNIYPSVERLPSSLEQQGRFRAPQENSRASTNQAERRSSTVEGRSETNTSTNPSSVMTALRPRPEARTSLPQQPQPSPASERTQSMTLQTKKILLLPRSPVSESSSQPARRHLDEKDCSICLEAFEDGDERVWCKAQCEQNFHKSCMKKWGDFARRQSREVTCAYCRAPWREN